MSRHSHEVMYTNMASSTPAKESTEGDMAAGSSLELEVEPDSKPDTQDHKHPHLGVC
jgi:hypothetical protein